MGQSSVRRVLGSWLAPQMVGGGMFGLTQLRQGEEIGRVGRHLRLTDHDRSSCTGRIAAESTEESRGEADIMALEGPELTLINEKHPSGRVTPAASKPVEERRRARFGDCSGEGDRGRRSLDVMLCRISRRFSEQSNSEQNQTYRQDYCAHIGKVDQLVRGVRSGAQHGQKECCRQQNRRRGNR